MKLHNFPELTLVREKIGAKLSDFDGSFEFDSIDKILETEGIEITSFEDLDFPEDGTIEYQGRKILVYIRDQYETFFPNKFHVARCDTIDEKIGQHRFNVRYVLSKKTTGEFDVNKVRTNRTTRALEIVEELENVALPICKFCLRKLNYKDYGNASRAVQREIFNKFDLDEFFSFYKIQSVPTPKYTSGNAPLNKYSDEFDKISKSLREARNWTCENLECRINLKDAPRFLHVHHKDFDKTNNSLQNLQVLCIECHLKRGGHTHMASNPDYLKFLQYKQKLNDT